MRIAILHYAAPPVIGGVERVIYYHATLLAEAGHQVTVAAGRGEAFHPRVEFQQVALADSRHPEVLALKRELDVGVFPAEAFHALVNRIYDRLCPLVAEADALVAHNVLSLHKNLPLTAALRRIAEEFPRLRFIAWHFDLAWKAGQYLPEMHDGYPWELLRQPWPNTRHVASASVRRQQVAELFGLELEDVSLIPCGVDVAGFLRLEPALEPLLEQTRLLDAQPWLLLPARITRRKNIELALRVTAALRHGDFPDAALIVTGPPGPHNPANQGYFGELKTLREALVLNGAVHFLAETVEGGPSDEAMAGLYQLADALILPSYEEGFGLPVLEAGLARLPIFCADIPALREVAGDQAAYFSPDGDPQHIAALISQGLAANQQAKLRRRVFDSYDWRRIVRDQIEPLLQQ
jgi:glycosyltransferase involved in cell wall biosynthesis